MQANRMFSLIYYLLEHEKATVSELSRELGFATRTIYRYVDLLHEAGVPIYAVQGRSGGIFLKDRFNVSHLLLSELEKKQILEGLQALSLLGSFNENELMLKLGSAFKMHAASCIEVDFTRWGNEKKDNAKFETLRSAILCRKVISITYVNSYGEESALQLYPLKLVYKAREWCLSSYSTNEQEFRLFSLHRIITYTVLEDEFDAIAFEPPIEKKPAQHLHQIVLKFSWTMAYRVYDEFDASQIEKQEDGTYLVSTKLPMDAWLIGFLLSFGSYVDVIEPASLREMLANEAEKIYLKNKSEDLL